MADRPVATRTVAQKRIFIFDSPRTRSQLFNKIFAVHPQLHQIFHPFYPAGSLGPERLICRFRQCDAADEVQKVLAATEGAEQETYHKCMESLIENVNQTETGGEKVVWIKEHVVACLQPEMISGLISGETGSHDGSKHTNISVMPDDFLDTLTPVFLIRHPALMIPSWYRAQRLTLQEEVSDESFRVFSSLKWARMMFELVRFRSGRSPLVLNGEDLVARPDMIVQEVCRTLDLDPKQVQLQWKPVPKDELDAADFMRRHFFGDLMTSDRIKTGQAKQTVDLDEEERSWSAEFGVEAATTLRRLVDENMEHYDYLNQYVPKT
ncbi:uncharacterized protein LTR77_010375 [Saxophila tyrrhenica]|uniref:Sulfotransferase n=1 Tax=Saxophila tyrrhenica TaxID=1690608 RepID=A0AAV9NVI4_9PEZI|nr:hypothetical protein LTR77_010375 [Saxophila tyrrhenica]